MARRGGKVGWESVLFSSSFPFPLLDPKMHFPLLNNMTLFPLTPGYQGSDVGGGGGKNCFAKSVN